MLDIDDKLAGDATAQSGRILGGFSHDLVQYIGSFYQNSAASNAGTVALKINSGFKNWNGSLQAYPQVINQIEDQQEDTGAITY